MPFALFLPPLFVAALFLFLPFFSTNRFFTILVSPDWRASSQARGIRYGYVGLVLAIAVASATLCLWAGTDIRVVYSVALVEPLALLAVWAWGWNRTLPARLHHPVLRSASLNSSPTPTLTLVWTLAALLPLAATAGYSATHYNAIPPQFPIHYSSTGLPDHMVSRTPLTVFGLPFAGAALTLFFAALLYFVSQRSAGIPDAGRYSSLTRCILLGSTWFVALGFSAATLLPTLPHRQTIAAHFSVVSSGLLLLWLLTSFGYAFRKRLTFSAAQSTTAEEHWRGGLWYYNPSDAALFVPKRLGFGYTLNLAHPESWLLMAATLAIVLVLLALKYL